MQPKVYTMNDKQELKRRITNIWQPQLKTVSFLWLCAGVALVLLWFTAMRHVNNGSNADIMNANAHMPIENPAYTQVQGFMGDRLFDDTFPIVIGVSDKGTHFNLLQCMMVTCVQRGKCGASGCFALYAMHGTYRFNFEINLSEKPDMDYFFLVINETEYISIPFYVVPFPGGYSFRSESYHIFTMPVYSLHFVADFPWRKGEAGLELINLNFGVDIKRRM